MKSKKQKQGKIIHHRDWNKPLKEALPKKAFPKYPYRNRFLDNSQEEVKSSSAKAESIPDTQIDNKLRIHLREEFVDTGFIQVFQWRNFVDYFNIELEKGRKQARSEMQELVDELHNTIKELKKQRDEFEKRCDDCATGNYIKGDIRKETIEEIEKEIDRLCFDDIQDAYDCDTNEDFEIEVKNKLKQKLQEMKNGK